MSTVLRIFKSFLSLLIFLVRCVFYRAVSSFLIGLLMLFVAVLMYVTFYQAYMPVVSHVKPVYLQFSSDCQSSSSTLCSYPEASVFFTTPNKANDERMLMRGQVYKVFLDIEMPPSPTNKNLGMFMVNVKFLSAKGKLQRSSSRSCMLHYESNLVRLFRTVFYSLPLTLGLTEEKQKVEMNFFDDYIDDSYNPAVQAKVVIMTKEIEIYSSTLRLQASFTGLRYVIFNWPVLFGCFAVLGNFITLTLVYSACVNQFTSTTVTVASNNQQPPAQSSVLAEQNDTLAHSTPAVTEIATSPENVSIINPVATTSVCTPGSSTCRARNSKMNGKHSIRITTFERKQLKLQNSLRKKAGNFDWQHESVGSEGLRQDNGASTSSYLLQDNMEIPTNKNGSSNSHNIERDKRLEHTKSRKREVKGGKNPSKRTTSSHSKKDQAKKSEAMKINLENIMSHSVSDTEFSPETKSAWDGFSFAKNWQTFKLPRIRRLGINLQENVLSFTRRVRHCTSDLELSSAQETRLVQSNCTRRSASTSDLTVFSTTVN